MKKELLFKNFGILQIKTLTKTRLFAVIIISFFFQMHLFGSVTKITPKEGILTLINTNVSVEVPSHPDELENTIVSDSTRQAVNIFATNAIKQFQENYSEIIPSNTISKRTPNVQEEDDKTIFISAGTTVFGLDQIYQVKVATIPEISQLNKFTKSTFLEKTNKTLSEKEADKKLARLVKKIQEEAKFHFSVSTGGNSKFTSALHENKTAVVVPSHIVQKHALASTYDQLLLKIESQLQKQKFYTSLSYLQFGKFRSSSLRGPPYAA